MNLVKHLDACETMGSATAICSDKTGTLTKNRMTVTRAYIGGEVFKTEAGKVKCSDGFKTTVSSGVQKMIADGIAINSTAEIKYNDQLKMFDHIGNSTDCALLTLTSELGFDYTATRDQFRASQAIVKLFRH
jgi:Ca2+ transporting ATPase